MRRPFRKSASRRRKAIVLVAVLVVITILSLAAYQFAELMTAEEKAADTFKRAAQARASADSGVHYAAALLANPDAFTNTLSSNPFNNPGAFQGTVVLPNDQPRLQGRVSIVSPLIPGEMATLGGQAYRYGVIDESGKINLNVLLKWDPTGQKGHDLLMQLAQQYPDLNLTEDIVNSILDWLDPDDNPRDNGAESDYYQTLTPPYNAKNGPLDSLDELLLVKGVTAEILYGTDLNRTGLDSSGNPANPGLAAYVTVYTHETNVDSQGNPRIYINESDLNSLADKLSSALGNDDLANYIIAYRLYGPSTGASSTPAATPTGADPDNRNASGANRTPAASTPAAGAGAAVSFTPLSGNDRSAVNGQLSTDRANSSQRQLTKISSLFDLVNSSVSVPTTTGQGQAQQTRAVTYSSPLNDPSQQKELLPVLLDKVTATTDTDLPGRVNLNTAPEVVIRSLPNLSESDVESILAQRPDPSSTEAPDPIFQTLAWLITEASVSPSTVKVLEPFITARSQVYRIQSVGYFDGEGPTVRIEAVIDTNNGRPRILMRRDLTELGKGFDLQNNQ
jgi:type II secretory pathway component PulK